MNFAAQIFYSSYLSERLERLYSPRPALKDSEENDPFWQRWEITPCSPLVPQDPSPPQLSTIVTDYLISSAFHASSMFTSFAAFLKCAHSNHNSSSTKPMTSLPNPRVSAETSQSRVPQTPLQQTTFSSIVYTKESPPPASPRHFLLWLQLLVEMIHSPPSKLRRPYTSTLLPFLLPGNSDRFRERQRGIKCSYRKMLFPFYLNMLSVQRCFLSFL